MKKLLRPVQDAIEFDRMTLEAVVVHDVQIFRVFGWVGEDKFLIDSFENNEIARQRYPLARRPQ